LADDCEVLELEEQIGRWVLLKLERRDLSGVAGGVHPRPPFARSEDIEGVLLEDGWTRTG
jgi:hypothetical protein